MSGGSRHEGHEVLRGPLRELGVFVVILPAPAGRIEVSFAACSQPSPPLYQAFGVASGLITDFGGKSRCVPVNRNDFRRNGIIRDTMSDSRSELKFTYQDYLNLPGDKRYELIDGDLLMVPAPRPFHQIVCARIETALRQWAEESSPGVVLHAPCDVYLSEHDVVQPDVLFISAGRLSTIRETHIQGPPDLVVEILSPSDPARDRDIKRKLYSRFGVQEYWIVDTEAQSIEILSRSEGGLRPVQTFLAGDSLQSPLLGDFSLEVGSVFRPIF